MKAIEQIDTTGFTTLREAMRDTAEILKNVSKCYEDLIRRR
jgi:hypothetical protein